MNLDTVFPIVGLAQDIKAEGLTKFELFSAMAMQALASQQDYQNEPLRVAREATDLAKALVDALDSNDFD